MYVRDVVVGMLGSCGDEKEGQGAGEALLRAAMSAWAREKERRGGERERERGRGVGGRGRQQTAAQHKEQKEQKEQQDRTSEARQGEQEACVRTRGQRVAAARRGRVASESESARMPAPRSAEGVTGADAARWRDAVACCCCSRNHSRSRSRFCARGSPCATMLAVCRTWSAQASRSWATAAGGSMREGIVVGGRRGERDGAEGVGSGGCWAVSSEQRAVSSVRGRPKPNAASSLAEESRGAAASWCARALSLLLKIRPAPSAPCTASHSAPASLLQHRRGRAITARSDPAMSVVLPPLRVPDADASPSPTPPVL